jgi:hypothetical protein
MGHEYMGLGHVIYLVLFTMCYQVVEFLKKRKASETTIKNIKRQKVCYINLLSVFVGLRTTEADITQHNVYHIRNESISNV